MKAGKMTHPGSTRLRTAQERLERHTRYLLPTIGLILGASTAAYAAPITTSPFGVDLDGNGTIEVEGSYLSHELASTRNGLSSLSIRYLFLTSESSVQEPVSDVFLIRLSSDIQPTGREVGGAVVNPGDVYTGTFDKYDFVNYAVYPAAGGGPISPSSFNDTIVIPAGTLGIGNTSTLTDGGIGWRTATFTFQHLSVESNLKLEIFLADSGDNLVDSALLVDYVTDNHNALLGFGGPTYSGNSDFEDTGTALDKIPNWAELGEVGVYSSLSNNFNVPVVFPANGSKFAVLSNVNAPVIPPDPDPDPNPIPEPTSLLSLAALASLIGLKRSR